MGTRCDWESAEVRLLQFRWIKPMEVMNIERLCGASFISSVVVEGAFLRKGEC